MPIKINKSKFLEESQRHSFQHKRNQILKTAPASSSILLTATEVIATGDELVSVQILLFIARL